MHHKNRIEQSTLSVVDLFGPFIFMALLIYFVCLLKDFLFSPLLMMLWLHHRRYDVRAIVELVWKTHLSNAILKTEPKRTNYRFAPSEMHATNRRTKDFISAFNQNNAKEIITWLSQKAKNANFIQKMKNYLWIFVWVILKQIVDAAPALPNSCDVVWHPRDKFC